MKKHLLITITLGAISCFADFNTDLEAAVATGDSSAVMALLPMAENINQITGVYANALRLTPAEEKTAFVEAIPESDVTPAFFNLVKAGRLSRGAECNALLLAGFQAMVDNGEHCVKPNGHVFRWHEGVATKAETIAFYDLAIRAHRNNDDTNAFLTDIENEIERLGGRE